MAEPDPDRDPDWPLHQRVVAAALRAVAASLPLVVTGTLLAGVAAVLPLAASLIVGLGWLFLLERRDHGPQAALWRTPLAGLLAGATAPFAGLWAGSAVSAGPEAGYATLGRFLSGETSEVPAMLWLGVVTAALLLPWTVARAASDRLWRHLAAGALALLVSALGAGAVGLTGPQSAGLAAAEQLAVSLMLIGSAAVFGPLLGLAGWLADRLAARLGVAGPAPAAGSGARVSLWLALLAGATWGATFSRPLAVPSPRGEVQAVQSLRAIATAQARFQQADPVYRFYADSLPQLCEAGLIDPGLASGQKDGYLFRLAHVGEHWCAAADPITAGVTGQRRFFANDSGEVWFTSEGAFPLDLERCEPPAHLLRVGGGK